MYSHGTSCALRAGIASLASLHGLTANLGWVARQRPRPIFRQGVKLATMALKIKAVTIPKGGSFVVFV